MSITTDSKLKDIFSMPEFSGWTDYLFWLKEEEAKEIWDNPMSQFEDAWNPASMCGGLERILQLCREGKKVFYPLYDKEQARKKPDVKQQVMIHFSVDKKAKFVVLCAGGGYGAVCSMVEAFPTAKILNNLGYHAFVANYRVGQHAVAPNPQEDLARAIRFIMEHGDELNIDLDDYAVAGFSAGGHLAASYGVKELGYGRYRLPKPAALFLAYPVITMGEYTHVGSRQNLWGMGGEPAAEWIYRYSIEKQVTEEYPPAYVWQCEHDWEVPIQNTRMLADALKQAHVPHIYKTFPGDAHGWGCGDGTAAEGWLTEAVRFWRECAKGAYTNGVV